MSRHSTLKKNGKPGFARGLADISTLINEQGKALTSPQLVKQVCSMESISEESALVASEQIASLESHLAAIFADSMGIKDFTEQQAEAAAIVAAAAGDLVGYSQEGYKDTTSMADFGNAVVAGMNGQYDYQDKVSFEAFSEQELRNDLPLSISYNFLAARQNEFGETWFPTQVLTPDQAALTLKVRKYEVFEQVRHGVTGKQTDFKRRNIVEAARDYTILANAATAIVPIWVSGTNDAYFMDTSYLATGIAKIVDGNNVVTRPMKPGVPFDLLGISQHAGLVATGYADHTDAVDAKVTLDAIYINITGTIATVPYSETYKFRTNRLPRADFQKSVEGNYRELSLNFTTQSIFINGETAMLDGTDGTLFDTLTANNLLLQLGVDLGGSLNTETGATNVFASAISKVKLVDADTGVEQSLTAGLGAVIDGYTYTVVGYDLTANRSNANRRTQGLLATPTEEVERYVIQLGSPITSSSPVGTNRDATDLETLVNVTRVRNSNNAVTTLLNYADTLSAYVVNAAAGIRTQVQGLGRHYVTPTYLYNAPDLSNAVQSVMSNAKLADVQAAIVNFVRDIATRLVRDSGYLQALDVLSAGQDTDFEVIIGTDQILSRFLMTSGDTRTLGLGLDSVVVASPDSRMDGKIVVGFRRKNVQGFDPLSSGAMAFIPELASSIQNTRNGAVYKEATVQPRTLHIPILPVLGVIDVTALTAALTTKLAIAFDAV